MRYIKTIGACAVVATVIMTMIAPPSYGDTSNHAEAELLLAAPFPGSEANWLRAREIAALTRQGLDPTRASEAIEVQDKLTQADLVGKLLVSMGNAYAGVWFLPTTARLHIGVISASLRRIAEHVAARVSLAQYVVMTPVRSTWVELLAAQKRWNTRLAKLFASAAVETALAPQRNAVAVTLSSSVLSRERAIIEHEAKRDPVNILVTVAPSPRLNATFSGETKCKIFLAAGDANCDKPITPGVKIDGPVLICTAGPLVISKKDKTPTYLLTAGHCVRVNGERAKWLATTTAGVKLEIGLGGEYIQNLHGDVGVIKVNNPGNWVEAGATPVFAVTAEWAKKEAKSFPLQAERAPMVGASNCVEGQRSGGTCGTIGATGRTITFRGGLKIEGLVEEAGVSTLGGDSGGPVIAATKGGYLAEGTIVGIGPSPYNTVWDPLATAFAQLSGLDLELLTTSNEVRPAQSKEEKEAGEKIEKKKKKKKLVKLNRKNKKK